MRGCAFILTTCIFLGTPVWSAEVSFPYTAEVLVGELEVRSGPDWDYYPALRLKRGDRVEVYRHDPGGWLAIRPPAGSMSWITARQVTRREDPRTGRVVTDGAVAWVGSSVSTVQQYKWQVRLQRDELVRILGERSLSVGPGFATETHYQIAPPAGEFRWIHAENALASQTAPGRSSTPTVQLTKFTPSNGPGGGVPAADAADKGNTLDTESGTAKSKKELAELTHRVDQLNLNLSMLVTRPIHQWDLQSLRERAATLEQSTEGTSIARQVRLISYRISEFETLQRRHQRMTAREARVSARDLRIERHGVSAAARDEPTDIDQTSWQQEIEEALEIGEAGGTTVDRLAAEVQQSKPEFDAEGWLMPVHSTRRIAPPFALLDEDGRVICYVKPSPGLNLRRYNKKYVGLFGQKKYITDLRASLLTVSRVVKRKF